MTPPQTSKRTGITFLIIGSAFFVAGIINSALAISGRPALSSLGTTFIATGTPFFVLGIVFLVKSRKVKQP